MVDMEKVIKAMEYHKSGKCKIDGILCPYWEYENCDGQLESDALAMLKEQPQWIPVTERKPTSMANKVIVYLQHDDLVSYIGYGHYEKYKGQEMWFDLEHNEEFSNRGYTVTHWMPLPNPPKDV